MATDAGIQFYGLWYLAGKTVSAQVAGLDCGDYVVDTATGSITVPFGSDTGGLMTAAYLASLGTYVGEQAVTFAYLLNNVTTTVTVPVVLGLAYTMQGQRLRPATAEDIKSNVGAALGKLRRTEIATVLLSNTIGLSVGTDFNALEAMVLPGTDGETALPATSMFTGVAKINLTDGHTYDSMFCWQVNRPWPCTVCATSSFLHAEEP
jgi:hypothetical protein